MTQTIFETTGIALTRPRNLETGVAITSLFTRDYKHHPEMDDGDGSYLLQHYDLHATRFSAYQDKMPFSVDQIGFHPTYEGKAYLYMDRHREEFDWWWNAQEDAAFWIVGSDSDPHLVLRCLS